MRIHKTACRAPALVIFASCMAANAGQVTVILGEYGFNQLVTTNNIRDPYHPIKVQIDKRVVVTDIITRLVTTHKDDIDRYEDMNAIFTDPAPRRNKTLFIKIGIKGKDEEITFGEGDIKEFIKWVKETRTQNGVW